MRRDARYLFTPVPMSPAAPAYTVRQIMDIDSKYPALSRFARTQGRTLKQLAKEAQPHDDYLKLTDCCQFVVNKVPRWSHADCYNYLATIDELFNRLGPNQELQKKFWNKLRGRGSSSTFLDTISEAAWALYFSDEGRTYSIEVPFYDSNQKTKDADISVSIDGSDLWLDVVNVEFRPLSAKRNNNFFMPSVEKSQKYVISKLKKKAISKYDKKFKHAILSGTLTGASVGVLICISKSEASVMLPFRENLHQPPPIDLFSDNRPGLNVVCVHTLAACANADYLLPLPIFTWARS